MKCELCPRMCGVDRAEKRGFCGMGERLSAAKAMLHFWEEPCVSGERGSGAVFFSGCVMKCAFCQNYGVSSENVGREISEERLAEIFLELQDKGAQNINLVNPTHFVPQIIRSINLAKSRGLSLPIVYNSGGYERVETLRLLEGIVDVYLPDVKYFDDELAVRLSGAPRYFDIAMNAVAEMLRQTGAPRFDESGGDTMPQSSCQKRGRDAARQSSGGDTMPQSRCQKRGRDAAQQSSGAITRGVIVRHLVLPGCHKDSVEVIKRLGERFGGDILFSLMSQYTPFGKVKTDPAFAKMNRRLTTFEYNKALDAAVDAGLRGYMQERSSAKEEYTPEFDFEGL